MVIPANYNFSLYAGDSWALSVTLNQANGSPLDLTGYTATSQMRAKKTDTAPSMAFVCTIPNPTTGVVLLNAASSATQTLTDSEQYWDLQISNGSTVTTLLCGKILVTGDVTR